MHTHDHSYNTDPDSYKPVVEFIKTFQVDKGRPVSILDVGCGNGAFLRKVIDSGIALTAIVGVDVSQGMLDEARVRLTGSDARLELASGFELSKSMAAKFDIIHMDSVLHHLIARTQRGSNKLAKRMVSEIEQVRADKGIIIVEELHYKSPIFPKMTSTLIFYGLKILNAVKIDARKFMREIQPGLEVNFFHQDEMIGLLGQFGLVTLVHSVKFEVRKEMRYFLLSELGKITYCLH